MTGRQKFLMSLAYKYTPQYAILNDRDREVFTLRVWLNDSTLICISDTPSLAGTNKFQVRVCEQTSNYYGPSPRITQTIHYFGKKYRVPGFKYAIVPAEKIEEVISSISYKPKTSRNPLKEGLSWSHNARDVWY